MPSIPLSPPTLPHLGLQAKNPIKSVKCSTLQFTYGILDCLKIRFEEETGEAVLNEYKSLLEDPVGYWDDRHRTTDEWRSGGDRGIDVARNRAFYAHRLGLLVSILDSGHLHNRLRILDAGCGKGWLSDQLANQGHHVTGIDTSTRAIELCREHRIGTFHVSGLDEFRAIEPYDAVVCMDVLFHILDDRIWQRSVENLGALTATNGLLIISDVPCNRRLMMGNYIVHRPFNEYLDVLSGIGLSFHSSVSYEFAGNPNAFLIFKS